MHKFNPEKLKKLDSPKRRAMLPPEELVSRLDVGKDEVVADIGCGIGYFTIPLALAAKEGQVYALDISEEMLEEAKKRIEEQKITNVNLLKSGENTLPLEDKQVQTVFMAMVLHEVIHPESFLAEIQRVLAPEGRLLILEWAKEAMEVGPPVAERLSVEETRALVAAAGFQVEQVELFKEHFYLLFAKNS